MSIFGFLAGTGYFFESCLYSKLGNANIFALINERLSSEWRALMVVAKKIFPAIFRQKKLKFLNFFETDSIFPIALCFS